MGAPALFSNLPDHDHFQLFSGASANVERTVKTLAMSKAEVAKAARVPQQSVRYDSKVPQALEERAREWALALNHVASFFKDTEKTLLWFRTPNPLLGGCSPRDMIVRGRAQRLIEFIQQALAENE
jgi:uncharacterized protein (DUF2384 family)